MSAGRGHQGQLITDIAVADGKSTWTDRSPGTGGQFSTQFQCTTNFGITNRARVQGHHHE